MKNSFPLTKTGVADWFLRFTKGMAVGMDVVLPGVSGAALAVVFGLYERIVQFVANPFKLFWKNTLFFIPVGCGALIGIWLVSHPIKFLLDNSHFKTPFYWFFVGAILGTLPHLWKKSGEKGRKPFHAAMLGTTFVVATVLFLVLSPEVALLPGGALGQLPLNTFTAFGAGAMVALVAFIPGFSSSTFLVMLGLYEPLNAGIKELDFSVLAPFAAGLAIFVFPFSKGIELLLQKTFTGFFHTIMGFVLASAVLIAAIASKGYDYWGVGAAACFAAFVCGAVFSHWMCRVSNK